ncbi:MAG: hypothetical protein LIP02_12275 [Bacteroidales bacterium]|nr:hypothetical protein [Bacteroidales bacterium]
MAGPPKLPPVNLVRQLLMFRSKVPHRVRFWSVVLMAFFFQLTGGVYLAALTQMVGSLAFLDEDVTMASYCSLIGLNIIFPILFRLKFGLFTRQLWFIAAGVEIACAIAAMYATWAPVLWVICLVAGFFKMLGMFGCMSTVQLNFTPTRNFAVFFSVIYLLVCGAIQVSGIITAYVSYFSNWRMMYLVIVVLMLAVEGWVYFTMRHDHRSGPHWPLKGIDWMGMVLWTGTCVVLTWIFCFGEHYDWWDAPQIRAATCIFLAMLALTLWHTKQVDQPFIDLKAFQYPGTWTICAVLLGVAVLQSTAHSVQPALMGGLFHYGYLNIVSLNYPELFGIIMGSILFYFSLVRWRWGIKQVLFSIIFFITYYEVAIYFLIDPATDEEMFWIPMFAFGVGEVMMEGLATYYLSQAIPFKHFFMNIMIIGFVRCGPGLAAAGALVHRMYNYSFTSNWLLGSAGLDLDKASRMTQEGIDWMSQLTRQALMMATKEVYGYMILLGIFIMALVLLTRYTTAVRRLVPRIIAVRRWMSGRGTDPTLST